MTAVELMRELKDQHPGAYRSALKRIYVPACDDQSDEPLDTYLCVLSGGHVDESSEEAMLWFEDGLETGLWMLKELKGIKRPSKNDRKFIELLVMWRDQVKAECEAMSKGDPVKTMGELVERLKSVTPDGADKLKTYLQKRGMKSETILPKGFLVAELADYEESLFVSDGQGNYAFRLAWYVNYSLLDRE